MQNNTFIIGDVHGCYHTLLKLVAKLPSNAKLIFVGDLCDKGNYSKEVIEFVINNKHSCIYGNHEYLFYQYARDAILRDTHKMWSTNNAYGGRKTVNNYKNDIALLHKHIKWIETLPLYIEIQVETRLYFITHGFGLPFYNTKDKKRYKKALFVNRIDDNIYNKYYEDYTNYNIINIFGHCKFDDILIDKDKKYYGIDTACVYGNKLTAIKLGTMDIIQENVDKRDIINY